MDTGQLWAGLCKLLRSRFLAADLSLFARHSYDDRSNCWLSMTSMFTSFYPLTTPLTLDYSASDRTPIICARVGERYGREEARPSRLSSCELASLLPATACPPKLPASACPTCPSATVLLLPATACPPKLPATAYPTKLPPTTWALSTHGKAMGQQTSQTRSYYWGQTILPR